MSHRGLNTSVNLWITPVGDASELWLMPWSSISESVLKCFQFRSVVQGVKLIYGVYYVWIVTYWSSLAQKQSSRYLTESVSSLIQLNYNKSTHWSQDWGICACRDHQWSSSHVSINHAVVQSKIHTNTLLRSFKAGTALTFKSMCSSKTLSCLFFFYRWLLCVEWKQVLDHERARCRRPYCLCKDRSWSLSKRNHGFYCWKGKSVILLWSFFRRHSWFTYFGVFCWSASHLSGRGTQNIWNKWLSLSVYVCFVGNARFLNSTETWQTGHEGIQHLWADLWRLQSPRCVVKCPLCHIVSV